MSDATIHPHRLFRSRFHQLVPWIVSAALFFNLALAVVHTNLMRMSSTHVILAEIAIIGLAASVAFSSTNAEKNPWLFLFILQVSVILLILAWRQSLDVKPVRDAIIVPVFIMLGVVGVGFNLVRYTLWTASIGLLVASFEILFLEQFTSLVNVLDFFIAKGTLAESARQFAANDLFVSGNRPNGRFLFDQLGIHRASSFFLEPVSFGAFGCVVGMVIVAHKNGLSLATYLVGLAAAFLIIWLADGRLAFGILVACLVGRPVLARLPAGFNVIMAPVVCGFLVSLHFLGVLQESGEGLGARLAGTIATLGSFDLAQLLGRGAPGVFTLDSGLGHLLATQGALGFLLYWLAPIVLARPTTVEGRLMVAFASIYFAFNLMFSQSMLTIKTAALLWMAFGYTVAGNHLLFGRRDSSHSRESG